MTCMMNSDRRISQCALANFVEQHLRLCPCSTDKSPCFVSPSFRTSWHFHPFFFQVLDAHVLDATFLMPMFLMLSLELH